MWKNSDCTMCTHRAESGRLENHVTRHIRLVKIVQPTERTRGKNLRRLFGIDLRTISNLNIRKIDKKGTRGWIVAPSENKQFARRTRLAVRPV